MLFGSTANHDSKVITIQQGRHQKGKAFLAKISVLGLFAPTVYSLGRLHRKVSVLRSHCRAAPEACLTLDPSGSDLPEGLPVRLLRPPYRPPWSGKFGEVSRFQPCAMVLLRFDNCILISAAPRV